MFSSHTISTSDIHVKSSEMSEEMETYVKELARSAVCLHSVEKDIAKHIKCELDGKGGVWHVIVGKNFGSYVTHDRDHFIYFLIKDLSFLIFRIG